MRRNLFALVAMLAALATGVEAHAVCTAANPNANVIESTPTGALTDNGNGTVTHTLTGLMWKQCAEGLSGAGCATGGATTFTWANALIQAKNASFAGQTDWRLPNLKELESIVESCGYDPSINQTRFPATPASFFWSSSSYVPTPANAWIVHFGSGVTDPYAGTKSGSNYARLVRGGQSFDAFDAQAPAGDSGGDSGGPSIGVTINGSSSSEVIISESPQGAAVRLEIEVNEIEGKELFFVLNAPALGINWSYLNPKNQWLAVPTNWGAIQPFGLALANGRHSLFGTQTLPAGTYEFYLGFDDRVDGFLNIVGGGVLGKFVQRTLQVQ